VWYDDTVRRLNADERGRFLGDFKAEDKILMLLDDGSYAFSSFDLSTHFDDKMIHLEKFDEDRPVSAVYHEGEKDEWYVKRFLPEFSKNPTGFIGEHEQSKLWVASTLHHPHVRIRYNRRFKHTRDREDDVLDLRGFISLKGVRALGNKLSALPVTEVTLEPPVQELETALEQELETARAADAAREKSPASPSPTSHEAAETEVVVAPDTLSSKVKPESSPSEPSSGPDADTGGQASLF
jgi:topoisomerase-4 subunit A